jgi:large subunit ribosomal protein L32
MPVPKQKKSKARTRKRRSTHDRITLPSLIECSNCGAPKLAHRICLSCGTYRGRQVVDVVELVEGGNG